MNPPYEPAPIDRYCRLFPPTATLFDLKLMEQLGLSMEADASRIPKEKERHPPPAGYTYFGQFIDHDLTLDETPLVQAVDYGPSPAQMINGADARLNLNHLYGHGPGSVQHGHLYEHDGASFRLGDVRTKRNVSFDFPMTADGPQSAEPRNTENLVLRQLCVMFLKLHNLAVQELPDTLDPMERFQRARNRVCWQYQWLVREDYLAQITRYNVYKQVVRNGQRKIDWQRKGFAIPVEFSQAAFRFGHSMVRATYDLNSESKEVDLIELFGPPQAGKAMDPRMAIEWSNFLDTSESTPGGRGRVPAMAIDTTLVPRLFDLPDSHVQHFDDPGAPPLPPQLAVRTLKRGASIRLATGEEASRALGLPLLQERGLEGAESSWKTLERLGLTGRTPLWYYILLEAEMETLGVSLGTLGTQLVLEVIDGSLRTDPCSYLSCFGAGWKPPPWNLTGGTTREIRRLLDLAEVTGLATVAPQA